MEGFLSKDVQVLVTNQSNHENRASTPLSPLSTCTSSSRMCADSPLKTERSATAIITRGKALALQAAKMQCNGSTDVLENSRRLGVRVWSLETAVRAVKRAKREETRRTNRSETSNTPHGVRRLKAPFLKVEDTSHRFKPLSAEFECWPIMDYLDRLSLDPGFQHGKLVTPSHSPAPPVDPAELLSSPKPRVQPLVALQRMNKLQINNLQEKQATPTEKSPTQIRKRVSQKEARNPPQEQKGILKKQQPERRGYCEACLARYPSLQEHRQSSSHQHFLSNPENFSRLDRAISEFPPIDQLMRNFSSLASLFSEAVSGLAQGDASPDLSPSPPSSPQLSPCTPSKVRDSARRTPQTCISFRPDASFLSYTPLDPHKSPSPPLPISLCPSFITEPDVLSTPRILKPRPTYLPTTSANAGVEAVRRSFTIPIDTPKQGTKPEITLLIPSTSSEVSSMEWCESFAQTRTSPGKAQSHVPQEQGDINQQPDATAVGDSALQDTCFKTPTKHGRLSHVWIGDAKTPPLPKDMDPRLFMFMNYPYRQSKVNAFKKLSKLL